MLLKTMGQRNGELLGFKDGGLWGAAAGLSGLLRGCRKAGPAGLRGLLTSPPHLAGQASAPLRGSLVNPCRGRRCGRIRVQCALGQALAFRPVLFWLRSVPAKICFVQTGPFLNGIGAAAAVFRVIIIVVGWIKINPNVY